MASSSSQRTTYAWNTAACSTAATYRGLRHAEAALVQRLAGEGHAGQLHVLLELDGLAPEQGTDLQPHRHHDSPPVRAGDRIEYRTDGGGCERPISCHVRCQGSLQDVA